MKSKFVKRNDSSRLILIFAGWGMDWRPFDDLEHPGFDIMVVWDYRHLTFNWQPLMRYDEICLIAWSMGVFAASVTIHEIAPRITTRIAINGTLRPIDERYGIPPAIWQGTLNALSPSTWRKFKRRMCRDAEQFAAFAAHEPRRTIADLAEELVALETHTLFHVEQIADWDLAIISRDDAIFPPAAQRRAWKDVAPVRMLEGTHLPDFKQIVRRLIIDKDHIEQRFDSARSSYSSEAVVQHNIETKLFERFNAVFGKDTPIVGNIIEIGPGVESSLTAQWYERADSRAKLMLWDLIDADYSQIAPKAVFERCDAELRIRRQPSASAGFIFSSSTIQWFNSPREFINECRRVLVPGGYLVLSSFASPNFEQLTSVTGVGLQLPTPADWRTMIPADMEILYCETEVETLQFDSSRDILLHLRNTGVNAVRFGMSATVMALRILRDYPVDPSTGRYHLSYRPIYIVARRRSDDN